MNLQAITPLLTWVLLTLGFGSIAAANSSQGVHLVETMTIAPGDMTQQITTPGTLFNLRTVRIFNQEEGQLVALTHYPGDRVEAGDQVAKLDDKLLQSQLAKARAARAQAEVDFDRQVTLKKQNAGSDFDYDNARTSVMLASSEEELLGTRLGYSRINAPFSGIVTERLVEPGDVVPRHSHLLTIEDTSSLRIRCFLSDKKLAALGTGLSASVTIDAIPGQTFEATVTRIHPTIDYSTRLGEIELAFSRIPARARAGQYARVSYTMDWQDRLFVPTTAIQYYQRGPHVFIVANDNTVREVAVTPGAQVKNRIEIVSGLAAGDRVVTKGFFGLKAGMTVKTISAVADDG